MEGSDRETWEGWGPLKNFMDERDLMRKLLDAKHKILDLWFGLTSDFAISQRSGVDEEKLRVFQRSRELLLKNLKLHEKTITETAHRLQPLPAGDPFRAEIKSFLADFEKILAKISKEDAVILDSIREEQARLRQELHLIHRETNSLSRFKSHMDPPGVELDQKV